MRKKSPNRNRFPRQFVCRVRGKNKQIQDICQQSLINVLIMAHASDEGQAKFRCFCCQGGERVRTYCGRENEMKMFPWKIRKNRVTRHIGNL